MGEFQLTAEEKAVVKRAGRHHFFTQYLPLCCLGFILSYKGVSGGRLPSFVAPSMQYMWFFFLMPLVLMQNKTYFAQRRLLKEAPDGSYARLINKTHHLSLEETNNYLRKILDSPGNQPSPALQECSTRDHSDTSLYPQPPQPESSDNRCSQDSETVQLNMYGDKME